MRKDDSCSWRIHASRFPNEVTCRVKSLKGEHHYARLQFNPTASYSWMAQQLLADYKADPSIKPPRMQQILMEKYGLQAKTHTVRRALNLLKVWFEGSHEESYALLLDYIEEINLRNSGSICSCITQSPNGEVLFKRTFISFKATVEGFLKGCRPLIRVDGCFLKGPYKGVLLVALGLDDNNGYFPIAYAVVQ